MNELVLHQKPQDHTRLMLDNTFPGLNWDSSRVQAPSYQTKFMGISWPLGRTHNSSHGEKLDPVPIEGIILGHLTLIGALILGQGRLQAAL